MVAPAFFTILVVRVHMCEARRQVLVIELYILQYSVILIVVVQLCELSYSLEMCCCSLLLCCATAVIRPSCVLERLQVSSSWRQRRVAVACEIAGRMLTRHATNSCLKIPTPSSFISSGEIAAAAVQPS